ncbi:MULTISPECIES: 3-oxoadipate enol-lactonase [Rhodomicrobium]|uniref:3-oxoadipate enol-lactonase n=1 Tax=Rhodomicrobium TaxID=1068 RepID=UPI000B4BD5DA|nr:MULTISPECIES: 3-oxoadipate enol-lactonase [Rhodomicrobium]
MPMLTMSDGCAIHYRIDGDDSLPNLLLSNSLGTTHEMWDLQMPVLTQHFRVIRYDNRGHGASDVPDGPYTIDRIARDAQDLIAELALAPLVYCGLSLGGMVGVWLSAKAPGLLRRAVFANTSAYIGQPEVWNQRIALIEAEGMQAAAGGIIQRWLTQDFMASHPALTAKLLAMVAGIPPSGYAAAAAAVRDMDLRGQLAAIGIPVLVIAGALDPATPPAMGEAIVEALPDARLAILDAAHLSNIEKPDEFANLLVKFLAPN